MVKRISAAATRRRERQSKRDVLANIRNRQRIKRPNPPRRAVGHHLALRTLGDRIKAKAFPATQTSRYTTSPAAVVTAPASPFIPVGERYLLAIVDPNGGQGRHSLYLYNNANTTTAIGSPSVLPSLYPSFDGSGIYHQRCVACALEAVYTGPPLSAGGRVYAVSMPKQLDSASIDAVAGMVLGHPNAHLFSASTVARGLTGAAKVGSMEYRNYVDPQNLTSPGDVNSGTGWQCLYVLLVQPSGVTDGQMSFRLARGVHVKAAPGGVETVGTLVSSGSVEVEAAEAGAGVVAAERIAERGWAVAQDGLFEVLAGVAAAV